MNEIQQAAIDKYFIGLDPSEEYMQIVMASIDEDGNIDECMVDDMLVEIGE